MAHALRDDDSHEYPLVAIDSYTKDYRPLCQLFDDAYFEMRENLWEFRLHEHIATVLSDTVLYLTHFWNSPLRLAFIDSSHHYEPTLNEVFEPRDLNDFTFFRMDQLAIIRNGGFSATVDAAIDVPDDPSIPRWIPNNK